MTKDSKDTARKFAIGAGIVAAVGYLAGLLTAPKSGKETREQIKDSASKRLSEVEKQLGKLHDDLDGLIGQAKHKADGKNSKSKKEFEQLVDAAKGSKAKVQDLMKAVRGGKAEDKDLKKAIGDATKALEHLRDYLSK